MRKILTTFIFGFLTLVVLTGAAFGQKGELVQKRVKFAKGKSSVTVKGFIADRLTSNLYIVNARAGQTLTVVFSSPRRGASVCILTPYENQDVCGRQRYSLELAISGDHQVLIDPGRDKLPYTLTISVR
jgi:hypothetical protein